MAIFIAPQEIRYKFIMRYSAMIIILFLLCCHGALGRNCVSEIIVRTYANERLIDALEVEEMGRDSFLIKLMEGQKRVIFQIEEKIAGEKKLVITKIELDGADGDSISIKGLNNNDIKLLNASKAISIPNDFAEGLIFHCYIDTLTEEHTITILSANDCRYTIRIIKPKSTFNVRVNNKEYTQEDNGAYNLGEIEQGSIVPLDITLLLNNELSTECSFLICNELSGLSLRKPEKAVITKAKNHNELSIKFEVYLDSINEFKNQILEFENNDCIQVQEESFKLTFNYKIISKSHIQGALWLWGLFSFILTAILINAFRGSKSRKEKYVLKILIRDPSVIEQASLTIKKALEDFEMRAIRIYSNQLAYFNDEKLKSNIEKYNLVVKTNELLRNNFLNELEKENTPPHCDKHKIEKLKSKWKGAASEKGEVKPESRLFGRTGKAKNRGGNKINSLQAKNQELDEKLKTAEEVIKDLRGKVVLLRSHEDKIKVQEKMLQDLNVKLIEEVPYPPFMKKYFKLLKEVLFFTLSHSKKVASNSIFYPFLDSILYVNGKNKAYNPIFNQVRKDEYLRSVLGIDNSTKLSSIDRHTFFEYIIKGRGFSLINSISKLFAYCQIPSDKLDVRARMQREGFDLNQLDLLYRTMDDILKTNFEVEIFIPKILKEKYQSNLYDKNNFSYLANHYSFDNIEDGLIYDVERIGFRSILDSNKVQVRPMVTYKIS